MKRSILFSVVFLLLVGLIGGFGYFQYVMKPELIKSAMAKAVPPPVTVTSATTKAETWGPRIPAIGTLTAIQGIDIAPQVGGLVRAIHFDSGQQVDAGASLIELDDFVEQADLKSNRAQLRKSELDLNRQKELLARGNTPQSNYDNALANRDTAAAVLERTKAVIAQKNIRAPFRGRLGIRKVNLGQYVSPGTPLVSLQKLDPIYVDFPVPEQNVPVLAVGQTVEVAVDAFSADPPLNGKITSIDSKVNPETRNVTIRAELANPDLHLLPGMFANVTVLAGAPQDVVTVPRTAIVYSLYGNSVYVVKAEDGSESISQDKPLVVERRFIRIGEERGDRVAVADGLKTGDTVVATGQIKLQPNTHVRVDNSAPLKAPAVRPNE